MQAAAQKQQKMAAGSFSTSNGKQASTDVRTDSQNLPPLVHTP
jgi:hypothetical protein